MLFDTHAHLNFSAFDGKVSSVITDSKKAGVGNITVPGTDIESSRKAVEIAEKYDGVYAAVGIHPHHAFEYVEQKKNSVDQDIKELKKILDHDSSLYILHSTFHIVAIGEVGLDRYEYKKTKYKDYKIGEEFIDLQKELLIAQLALAKKYKLSVIVHNREARGDMLSLLDKRWDSYFERRMVFHCCEPDAEILEFAKKHKLFIGVDGDVTYWREKKDFIKTVPLDMLVLETDSPFLIPEPVKSQKVFPNTPANLPIIAERVARLRGESVETVSAHTTQNARHLFQIYHPRGGSAHSG